MRSGSGGDDGGDRVQYVPIDIPLGLNRMGEEDPSVDILKHSNTTELTIYQRREEKCQVRCYKVVCSSLVGESHVETPIQYFPA